MDNDFSALTPEGRQSNLPDLSPEQRSEYLARATSVRHERSMLLHGIKKREIDPREVLASCSDAARNIRAEAFVESWPGVGRTKAAEILKRSCISGRRHLKGIGKNQRAQLIAEMPPFGDSCDEDTSHSAGSELKG